MKINNPPSRSFAGIVLFVGLVMTGIITFFFVETADMSAAVQPASTRFHNQILAVVIPALGVFISALLFISVRARYHALCLAEKRTSELERAEESLRAGDDLQKMITETAADGIITMNEDATILTVNAASEQIFGCKSDEMVGRKLDQFTSFASKEGVLFGSGISKIIGGKHLRKGIQFAGKHKSGSELALEISLGVTSKDTHPVYIGIIRDISHRKKVQQALFQVQKTQAIGALASGIAHDFNNVFAAVLSNLEMTIAAEELPDSLRNPLINAKASASRGAELVGRLMAFSRHSLPQMGSLDLPVLVEEVVALLHRSVSRNIQIRALAAPSIWPVNGDDNQIKQVLLNLCLNARDAMADGGDLTISLSHETFPEKSQTPRRAGEFVRITVADSGTGMSPEVMQRLFEPYFTTKEFGRGAGLGLSIANNIILEHGGWMEVESAPGQGSRFYIFLPHVMETSPGTTRHAIKPLETKQNLDGSETILVADDDSAMRMLISAVLSYRGYTIVEAENGHDLLQKLDTSSGPIDLIVADVQMPRLSAWEVLKQLRTRQSAPPVIVLSGGQLPEFSARAKREGADGALGKPFENVAMVRKVREILDEAKRKKNEPQPSSPAPVLPDKPHE